MAEGAALRAVRGCLAAFPREARGERGAGRQSGRGRGGGRPRGERGGLKWLRRALCR